jgi:5-methylcytosine-specific restriction endonuclease McrBC regulatory subunit McrC
MTNEEKIDVLEKQVLYLTKQLVKTNDRLIQIMDCLNDAITMLDEVDSRAINDDLKMLGFIKEMMSTETKES